MLSNAFPNWFETHIFRSKQCKLGVVWAEWQQLISFHRVNYKVDKWVYL